MDYKIEAITEEEKRNHSNAQVKLVEQGYEDIILGFHNSRANALVEKGKWEARDRLSDKIEDFYAEMQEDFGTVLSEGEITEMIKGYD